MWKFQLQFCSAGCNHVGGVSQPCQEFGALLQRDTCAVLVHVMPSARPVPQQGTVLHMRPWPRCRALACSPHAAAPRTKQSTRRRLGGTTPSHWTWSGHHTGAVLLCRQILIGSGTNSRGAEVHWGGWCQPLPAIGSLGNSLMVCQGRGHVGIELAWEAVRALRCPTPEPVHVAECGGLAGAGTSKARAKGSSNSMENKTEGDILLLYKTQSSGRVWWS